LQRKLRVVVRSPSPSLFFSPFYKYKALPSRVSSLGSSCFIEGQRREISLHSPVQGRRNRPPPFLFPPLLARVGVPFPLFRATISPQKHDKKALSQETHNEKLAFFPALKKARTNEALLPSRVLSLERSSLSQSFPFFSAGIFTFLFYPFFFFFVGIGRAFVFVVLPFPSTSFYLSTGKILSRHLERSNPPPPPFFFFFFPLM